MTQQPERPTCATCPYWVRLDSHVGECHAGHPTRYAFGIWAGQSSSCAWPKPESTEWCGQHPDMPAWIKATQAS